MIRIIKKNFISLLAFSGISIILLLVSLLTPHSGAWFLSSLVIPVILISGLGFTRKSLQFYFQDKVVAICLILFAFATNLLYVGIFSDLLQPVLLFTLYSMLVYLTICWHRKSSILIVVFVGIITGVIILVHPTGYFAVLIPILWNVYDKTSWKEKISIRKSWIHFLIFIIVAIITNIIAYITLNAKPGEIPFLDFILPGVFCAGSEFLWNDLFSFNHGWLIYSPILIIPALGFYFIADRVKHLFFAVFVFCTLDIIAESCWTDLGDTAVFGQIAFIQLYAFLVFPASGFIAWILKKRLYLRVSFFSILILLLFLNFFQTYQYRKGLLVESGMTEEIYSMVFCRTNLTDKEKVRISEITGVGFNNFSNEKDLVKRTLLFYDFEKPNPSYVNKVESEHIKYGRFAMRLDENMRFSMALDTSYQKITNQRQIKARISAVVYCKEPLQKSSLLLIFTSSHNGKNYRYRFIDAGQCGLKAGQWTNVAFDYLTPIKPLPQDRLKGYIYYSGNQKILIDNLKFEIFEHKK
jgi:hypothetical protein